VAGVVLDEAYRHRVEGGLNRGYLVEHIGTPAVVLDHALEAAGLALDAPQTGEQSALVLAVAPARLRVTWSLRPWARKPSDTPSGLM
jgi:hypothetical protein